MRLYIFSNLRNNITILASLSLHHSPEFLFFLSLCGQMQGQHKPHRVCTPANHPQPAQPLLATAALWPSEPPLQIMPLEWCAFPWGLHLNKSKLPFPPSVAWYHHLPWGGCPNTQTDTPSSWPSSLLLHSLSHHTAAPWPNFLPTLLPHVCLHPRTVLFVCHWIYINNILHGDFSGGPLVKNSPCNAGVMSSIPGQGTKIPHAMELLSLLAATKDTMQRSHMQQLRPDRVK